MNAAGVPLLLWALCLVALAEGQPKARVRCSVECTNFSKALPERLIRSYRMTEPTCKKKAIIFTTVKSKEICADSNADWVKKIINKLDGNKTTVMPPRAATSAEEPGSVERRVGLLQTDPPQVTAPASGFQGTGTTVRERTHAPAASTEVSSKSPVGRQDLTQLPAGSTPAVQEEAAHSAVTPEGKRETSNSLLSSAAVAAGMGSSQPTPHPTGQDTASPNSNSGLMPATEGSNQPATATAPQTASVSTLSSTTAPDKAASVHTSRALGATAFDHSLPVGKQEPSDTVVFTHKAFSGQARVQMITVRPKNQPLPSFLSKSQMHFVIPVSVVCGLMVGSVALVWVYLKFGVKPEDTSREMVQGLLYQQPRHQDNVYPMEVL
ncbi:fractalkine-like protein [Turdus rufiventris]|nr:fractalkine-like protein [Turdus rufiventris]